MDARKTRIVGALAMATAAAIVIQEGRGISPGLFHCLTIAAFVAAILGAVGYGFRLRRDAEWDRIQREAAISAGAWDVRQNWRGDFLVIDRNRGIASLFSGARACSPEPLTAEPMPGPTAPATGDPRNLFDVLSVLDRVLIVGGQGAGKSELLRWLADHHAHEGEVVIIDSHAAPGEWPESVRVVGMGRDYPAIAAELETICAELDRRYGLRSTGDQLVFEPLTVVFDEMFVTTQFLDIGGNMRSLLAEARKVGIRLVCAGQSDRAGALGIKGNFDLRAGFEAVAYLERTPDGRRRGRVFLGAAKDAEVFDHPGIFPGGLDDGGRHGVTPGAGVMGGAPGASRGRDGRDGVTPAGDARADRRGGVALIPEVIEAWPDPGRFYESRRDRTICEMYEAGNSLNDIARAVWGSSNGRRTGTIKEVLGEYGLIRSGADLG